MTHKFKLLMAAIMSVAALCLGVRSAAADGPGIVHARELTLVAVVEDIDYPSRTVILRGPAGNVMPVSADGSVKNFDQVKKGDKVQVTYFEAVAIQVMQPQDAGAPVGVATVQVAPPGDKPAMVTTATERDSVVVQAIDYANRLATLQMSDGSSVDVEIDPGIKNIESVKQGDHIVVQRTRAVAVFVHE